MKKELVVLKNRIEGLSELDGARFTDYMAEKELFAPDYMNLAKASEKAIEAIKEFFTIIEGENPEGSIEGMHDLKGKESSDTKEMSAKEKNAKLAEYKQRDNLVDESEFKQTIIENVIDIDSESFATYLTARQLAELFKNGNLVFDGSMQRGVKEDKEGNLRAIFKERHVTDIYNAMVDRTFTPTQIHLVVVEGEEGTIWQYSQEENSLDIFGRIRLLDGQHRVRACLRLLNDIELTDKVGDTDVIDAYKFNVVIHTVTPERAREIYSNIDKNVHLDKSQVGHLGNDESARIINYLNTIGESDLRGKIATARPVGSRLVLFSTLKDALKTEVQSNADVPVFQEAMKNFFNYLTERAPKAFGNNEKARAEFKELNLLNENTTFYALTKLAVKNRDNYRFVVDKIVDNINFFNKDNPIWLDYTIMKKSVRKGQNPENAKNAMNNTTSGIKKMENIIRKHILEENVEV